MSTDTIHDAITEALVFRPGAGPLAECKTVRDLITAQWSLKITALTPIAHSSGTMGNDSLFMTERVVNPERPGDSPEDIPCLTGNSLRHALREGLTWLTLRVLGVDLGSVSPAALHFLLSGGSMGKQASTLDLEGHRRLTAMFPYLPLFGGGLGTALVAGKLQVGSGILICRQNGWRVDDLCPPMVGDAEGSLDAEEYRERRQGTRHDARRQPVASLLMPPKDSKAWDKERLKTSKANESEGSDSTQMIYGREVLVAGSTFLWQVGGHFMTPLEHSALICALLAMQQRGWIGAASGTGHGRIKMRVVGASGETAPLADALRYADEGEGVEHVAKRAWAAPYVDCVTKHGDEIREWLSGLR